jgi:hypothetical protein
MSRPTIKELQAAGCESLRGIAAGLEERGIPECSDFSDELRECRASVRRHNASLTQDSDKRHRLPAAHRSCSFRAAKSWLSTRRRQAAQVACAQGRSIEAVK